MNGWRLRLFVGVERLLARLGLKLPGKIMYIGGSDTLPPPLSRDEEAELIARLDGGDEGVKSQLIERNLRLVVYIARRFENTGVGIEDLISIGAYKAGTNPRLDYALGKMDGINQFLTQGVDEAFSYEEDLEAMRKLL